ncbi:MAG: phosphoribosylformylglycinamidine synthase I [Omnitrophica WOR_2 bacterium RIFCSPHIGHO2_02_FULL_68_15]|nr:MAG: phosphoribosylformylglycinamidine synthase I [Omnitrophica WOR_2 bacterium RIFCSPHIGHO2_02_FULL_68_15]
MAVVKAAVLRAPGTNCDAETRAAFEQAGAQADAVQLTELIAGTARLDDYQILALPGGFTYGDDVAAGRLAANELKYRLRDQVAAFVKADKLVIGICNGFQILVKAGLLPGGQPDAPQTVTLTWNDSGRFEDRWVRLKPEFNVCIWTQGLDEAIELPVAHGEGKFVPRDASVLEQLVGFGQIVFHYCDADEREAGYPWNPNGSVGNIAGICDPTGRIFGLMPHPERHVASVQHPRWTRGEAKTEGDGLQIFSNGVRWVERRG